MTDTATLSPRRPLQALSSERAVRPGDRGALARLVILVLITVYGFSAALSLEFGASGASLWNALSAFLSNSELSARDRIVLFDIRLPRLVMGSLVGAGLAVSGAAMQGLFRNPLADPGIVGVSAGAALGAVTMIVLGGGVLLPLSHLLGAHALPVAAFCGAVLTTAILHRVATRQHRTSIATLLLAGIALGALYSAVIGFLIFLADDQQLRDLTFWQLGSLGGATWSKVWGAGPIIILACLFVPFLARGLDALALGEAAAHHMGIPVQRLKVLALIAVAAATGASVAVSGMIGFVGIVVPHILRFLIGPGHRNLLIASAFLGASLLLLADTASRIVVAPAELPIGIVTAAVGAPFFLWVLLRRRGLADL